MFHFPPHLLFETPFFFVNISVTLKVSAETHASL